MPEVKKFIVFSVTASNWPCVIFKEPSPMRQMAELHVFCGEF
jgi:hypothetical protein